MKTAGNKRETRIQSNRFRNLTKIGDKTTVLNVRITHWERRKKTVAKEGESTRPRFVNDFTRVSYATEHPSKHLE